MWTEKWKISAYIKKKKKKSSRQHLNAWSSGTMVMQSICTTTQNYSWDTCSRKAAGSLSVFLEVLAPRWGLGGSRDCPAVVCEGCSIREVEEELEPWGRGPECHGGFLWWEVEEVEDVCDGKEVLSGGNFSTEGTLQRKFSEVNSKLISFQCWIWLLSNDTAPQKV